MMSWGENDTCYGTVCLPENYDSDEYEPKYEQMTFDEILNQDISTQKFYQDIAEAAKEWSDKPSDRKKFTDAMSCVLDLAKKAMANDSDETISETLKHKESVRIVSNIVEHFEK